jgi:glyoxylase-like metal-dependent hydrolase (beta-lactamase superfamily II)
MKRALASEWYRLKDMGQGVTLIEEPFIKQFYRCNMWYVQGRDWDMLVDTGMGVVSLSFQISILRARPILAIATHTHFDHIGCHSEFKERIIHTAEAELLTHPTRENTLADSYVSLDIFTKLPPEPFDPNTYEVPAAPATRIVDDGDIIDLGDRQFEVIHTPGHSPGSISLWEDSTGILIAGDIVYDGPLVEDTYHSNMNDYIASMERILPLPVSIVHGGHFDSFGQERYREIIGAWLAEKRKDKSSEGN